MPTDANPGERVEQLAHGLAAAPTPPATLAASRHGPSGSAAYGLKPPAGKTAGPAGSAPAPRDASALARQRPSWKPRQLAERLARRARRAAATVANRPGANPGGTAVRERYGPAFYSSIGARGGATVLEERGVEYLHDIGARGGAATSQRYGREHYAEIGRKGGLAGRGRKRPVNRAGQLELPLQPPA